MVRDVTTFNKYTIRRSFIPGWPRQKEKRPGRGFTRPRRQFHALVRPSGFVAASAPGYSIDDNTSVADMGR